MSAKQTIPVQLDAEKLCKHTLTITNNLNNFPKKYRFTLVDRILSITFDIHDLICDANNTFDMQERIVLLGKAISVCRKLKFYVRMCHEVIKPKCSIGYWNETICNIEKQLLNWKTATKKL